MGDFTMPSLGADMERGTVTKWLVKPGDQVQRGDVVAEVETEKSTIEIEIFETGTIEALLVGEGEEVPVGTVLARVAAPTAGPTARPSHRRARPTARKRPSTPAIAPAPAAPPAAPLVSPAIFVETTQGAPVHSPIIRRLAAELGVDLSSVRGSGVGGSVTRADVETAAKTVAPKRSHLPSSPLARRLAAELGVNLTAVEGTGPGGAVLASDVRSAALAETPPPPAPARQQPSAGLVDKSAGTTTADRQAAMRHAIGALMARSKREIPHYYLSTTLDVTAVSDWLARANSERPVADRLLLSVLLLKATALAVKRVPEMNGFYVDDAFEPSPAVHLGVAISLRGGGVIAPAIHDADRLSPDELMVRLHDLVGRARQGVLRSSEMSDPTVTVTNLGDLGVEAVFGVIYPPQVALVGFGRVTERPVARAGLLGVAPCVTATLSADHRASDGHRGGRFLAEIDRLLQKPEEL